LATLLRAAIPEYTLDVHCLIRAPGPFVRDHRERLAWWSIGLAAATLLAWVMADPRVIHELQKLGKRRPVRWLTSASSEDIAEITAWWRVFEELKPEGTGLTNVGVLQDNNSYIQGSLLSSTSGGLDYDKRELVLTAPLVYVTEDGVSHELPVQMVVIAGRTITRLDVTHLPAEAAASGPNVLAGSEEQGSAAGQALRGTASSGSIG
jgi:hypothetical protein